MNAPFAPLAGVRVLDLSRYLPGPLLTRILADLGADVIKVEEPSGDPARYMPPMCGEHSAVFAALNFGKRSVAVDLKQAAGLELVRAMVPHADVIVETYRPGVLERLGLSFDRLQALRGDIILCSLTGYGQQGEFRHRAGHDVNYAARAGLLDQLRTASGTPTLPSFQIADVSGALHAAIGVLAALLERARTGCGRHLDISLTRSAYTFLALEAPRRSVAPAEAPGQGMLGGGLPCYGVYRTRDGADVALGALEPKFFAAFAVAAGVPELAAAGLDPDSRSTLRELFACHDLLHWRAVATSSNCCMEPVQSATEAGDDPAVGVDFVALDGLKAMLSHVGANVVPPDVRVPGVGEHSLLAMRELGIDPALVEAARAAGALLCQSSR